MQALEKKLEKGFSLEAACIQLSIDLEIAKDWLNARKELDDFNRIVDGIWGRSVAVEAIGVLKGIIAECPDYETRRRASKDLLDHYRDERKRLEQKIAAAEKKAGDKYQNDLFDVANNPWIFPNEDS